jgi:hypothetical protein
MWSMARLTRWTYVAVVAGFVFSEIRKIWQAFPRTVGKITSDAQYRVRLLGFLIFPCQAKSK